MSEPVPSITSAPEPLAVDQARRTRSYLIQMSIRVVCIIGAVLVDGWIRWALVAAALVCGRATRRTTVPTARAPTTGPDG